MKPEQHLDDKEAETGSMDDDSLFLVQFPLLQALGRHLSDRAPRCMNASGHDGGT
jgi:hypothetical protein